MTLLASEVEGTTIRFASVPKFRIVRCHSVTVKPPLIYFPLAMRVTVLSRPRRPPANTRFADAAIEASDGTVYFSDASTRFGFDRWFYDFLESRVTGRLLRYDPRNGETSVVLDRLSCANGVALSRDETFVVVCETWR